MNMKRIALALVLALSASVALAGGGHRGGWNNGGHHHRGGGSSCGGWCGAGIALGAVAVGNAWANSGGWNNGGWNGGWAQSPQPIFIQQQPIIVQQAPVVVCVQNDPRMPQLGNCYTVQQPMVQQQFILR
jgi:hypothetical protein